MTQFFVLKKDIVGDKATIRGEEAKHLTSVLRKKVDEQVQIFNGNGKIHQVKIEKIGQGIVETKILSRMLVPEPKVKLYLFPAVLKQVRMDYLIQKVSELGI